MRVPDDMTERVPVQLGNGEFINIEVTQSGRQNVSVKTPEFRQVTKSIEGIVEDVFLTLKKVNPNKATIKFGMELSIESGQLTAVLVKGTSKANLEITLEWSR